MKKCRRCNELKPMDEYYAHNKMFDGRLNICKECVKSKNSEHRNKNIERVREYDRNRTYSDGRMKYRRSFNGLSAKIYNSQKSNSKTRGHCPPKYSLNELREWMTSNGEFYKIYKKWQDTGYSKNCIPSVDRLDDSKPYSLDNIQMLCWEDNANKAHCDIYRGKIRTHHKTVECYTLDGKYVNTFDSISIAGREMGINKTAIGNCVNGKTKTSGGYIWKKKDISIHSEVN